MFSVKFGILVFSLNLTVLECQTVNLAKNNMTCTPPFPLIFSFFVHLLSTCTCSALHNTKTPGET